MKLLKIFHYPKDDRKCQGDYYDVEIRDSKKKMIVEFGDDYHDKGSDKAEGFIKGVEWATGEKVEVTTKNVADREEL